jgi:sialic acid synthase SpsE
LIDGRVIGQGEPTFVIAEIGVNHDGSANKAIELAKIAKGCGADAVKLQVFRASRLLHASSAFADYQQRGASGVAPSDTPADMLRRYELSKDDIRRVVNAIRELKLVPLATPFSPADVEPIAAMRLPAVKIASPDMVNWPLLQPIANYGRPMLVSTGAATIDEIDTTVQWLRDWDVDFALMHCVCAYPTPAEFVNLCWIGELAARYDVPVGFSDHTTETITGGLAAAAGALIIERHITHDRSAKGPDHASSSDPTQFERYVKQIRDADRMRGTPGKAVLDIEQDVRTVSRQSLVVKRGLKAGEVINETDLTVQRPGTGISAAEMRNVIGRRVASAVQPGAMLTPEMLEEAA